MVKRTIQRIDTALKHISIVKKDINGVSLEQFKNSDILVRATAFSLSQIGEQMVNIDDHLEDEYKDLPWKAIRNMCNIIVHVYDKVKAEVVYEIATKDLESLENSLLKIKADLEEQL